MSSQAQGGRLGALAQWCRRAATALGGLVSLLVGLSLLASLPVVQIVVLGYLLAAGVEVARSGRVRDGLRGLEVFARVGAVALGFWLLLWVPRLIASLAESAFVLAPDAPTGPRLELLALGLALLLCVHGLAAVARGGRLRYMLIPRPLRELEALRAALTRAGYRRARAAVWATAMSVRELGLVRLGLHGLVTGAVWLLVPTSLLALGSRAPAAAVLGCLVLAWVVTHLPFLQLHVASERRLGAMMELEVIRRCHARAPLAMAGALLLTVVASLPLYLVKIELIPREAMWLPGLVFVGLMLPARLACGLALHRGLAAGEPRHWSVRWLARLVIAAVVLGYAVSLYFTQYLSWYGTWSLYEQHAFLLPVPFVGL